MKDVRVEKVRKERQTYARPRGKKEKRTGNKGAYAAALTGNTDEAPQ